MLPPPLGRIRVLVAALQLLFADTYGTFLSMSAIKPGKPETEYFARIEAEKKKKIADEMRAALDDAEHQRLKELHWMRCPKCGMELHSMVFRGVNLDKCFHCEGVFLDQGELEKVAGRENGFLPGLLSLFRY